MEVKIKRNINISEYHKLSKQERKRLDREWEKEVKRNKERNKALTKGQKRAKAQQSSGKTILRELDVVEKGVGQISKEMKDAIYSQIKGGTYDRKKTIKKLSTMKKARAARQSSSFSAGGAGDAYTWRFASVAMNAYEIVSRLSNFTYDEDIENIVYTANRLINYSTSDTYDYDTIKEENRNDIRELENAIESAKAKFNGMAYEEALSENGEFEDFESDASEIFDALDQLQSILQELDNLTSDTKIPNQMGGLSAVGGSLSVDIF